MASPKASSIVLVVALVGSSLAAAVFYMGKNDEHAKRVWTENQLQKITEAKDALEKERDELAKAKEALESQLTDATTQAKTLAEQLAAEKRAKETLTSEVNQTREESAALKTKLEGERKEKQTLTEDLAKAKQSYQALSNELTTLRQAKEALERRVKEMFSSQAAETEKIVVKPSTDAASLKPPTVSSVPGKVLVVNTDYNFIVVNLGSKDGLKVGSQVVVLRDEKTLGKAQVEKLYENMAAATLLTEEKKGQIKVGDLVRVIS